VINMSLSSDLLYITPKLRVIYSTCLNEKNIQDLLQANSIDDYMYILKETSYYQYLKNIDPKDLLSLELALDSHLYNLTKIFQKIGGSDVYMLISSMRKIMLIKMFASIIRGVLERHSENMRKIFNLLSEEAREFLEKTLSEEMSISRIMTEIERSGFYVFSRYYKEFSKTLSSEISINLSLDLSLLEEFSEILTSYPEIIELICPEADLYIINFLSKSIMLNIQDKLSTYIKDLLRYSCKIDPSTLEEMSSSDETRFLTLLRRIYPSTLISQDLTETMINIRGFVRKNVRKKSVSYIYSYPFNYGILWSVFTLKRFDIEDLVSIASGKIGLISTDMIRRFVSI